MWKTVIILGCSIGAVLATPIGFKNMPIMAEEEMQNQKSEMAMTTLNLPSNATSIRADITDGFTCTNKTYGYYADVENECQIFHVCLPVVYPDGRENTFRWSFICPEETLFSQESFTCVRGEDMNFGCDESEKFYDLNRNFGMIQDSSMEMSSLEADMDEYYMKTDLGSSALTKASEDITEHDLPLIKPVEKKTENPQRVSLVKPHKVPLRNTAIKPKPEPSKKPLDTSTTKRVYTKNYNKVRRPLRPQSSATKAPQQIHIEVPPQTSKFVHSTTVKTDIKKPFIAIQKQEPQKLVHDVEELMVTKVMENFQKVDDVPEHQVQILNDEVPVMVEEIVQNLDNPKQDKNSDNKVYDNEKETTHDNKKSDQNVPTETQNVKEQIKTQPSNEEGIKIELMPDNTETELTAVQLFEEQTEKIPSTAENIEMEVMDKKSSENEDTVKLSGIPESATQDAGVEANSKTHINGQLHTSNENDEVIQTENIDYNAQKEIVASKDKPSELEIEQNNENMTLPEANQENQEEAMSSQEQEEMIIKTITDLMNAANLLSTEKLPLSEEASTVPNLFSMNNLVQTSENTESQVATETSNEKLTEGKVTPDTGLHLNEENTPESDVHTEQNSEMVNEELLNKVSNSNNVESDQYSVPRPGSINSLGTEENKNELESENLNKGGEIFSAPDASSDIEETSVKKQEGVSIPVGLKDNEQNIEIVESLPTQDVLDEEPLAEQMSESKLEETVAVTNPVPIHSLIMSQPSQPYITLSSEMNGQFSSEQVIPVFIIQDEAMSSENTGNSENKAQIVDTVKDENLDASPQKEEEIKPIYQRIKEFHSNLLKADLLSADLDDEPAVHEISEKKENSKSSLETQEEKQMDASIESLPNKSALDFLAQTDVSKDFLKVMPLETENMQTSPELAIPNLSGQDTEIKLKEEIETGDTSETPLEQSKASRRLQKKMDPRKRRFLFKADAS